LGGDWRCLVLIPDGILSLQNDGVESLLMLIVLDSY
jgi:hypothetical protein